MQLRRRFDRWLTHDRRVLLMSLGAGLPGSGIALILLWRGDFEPKVQWTLTLFILGLWWGVSASLRDRVVYRSDALEPVAAAGNFSIRPASVRTTYSAGPDRDECAGRHTRGSGSARSSHLVLRTVMEEIPVAVFAFDPDRRLRLVNRAGERLLARPIERLLGRDADELGLASCLGVGGPTILAMTFPGSAGRWEVRSGHFRQRGIPLELLVMNDVSQSLRDEERQAWQRLIRVIGHEINNSLAPIKSIAHSLERILSRDPMPSDWEADMRGGLQVIGARADALGRFTAAYAQLARPRADAERGEARASRCPGRRSRTPPHHHRERRAGRRPSGRSRSARAAADQPRAQRRRRVD